MSLTIFNKEYDGESLYELGRDIGESLIAEYNPIICSTPYGRIWISTRQVYC